MKIGVHTLQYDKITEHLHRNNAFCKYSIVVLSGQVLNFDALHFRIHKNTLMSASMLSDDARLFARITNLPLEKRLQGRVNDLSAAQEVKFS